MNLTRLTLGAIALLIATVRPPMLCAAPERPLNAQLKALAATLNQALANDPRLKGKTVKMGLFNGPQLPNTNFGQRIRLQLGDELKAPLDGKTELTITGRYDYVESDDDTAADDPGFKLHVLRITAVVEDNKAKELARFPVEINSTDDIIPVLGGTAAPPLHGTQKQRNESAKKAHDNPSFKVIGRTRVGPINHDKHPFSVEILVKDRPDGEATAIEPQDQKGQAFVDVKPTKFYEIRLYNDADFEAAAEITIDGLDVVRTFCKDAQKPSRYLVPSKESTTIRGWLHTTKPGAKDSVLSFLVTELGRGAATRLKSTGEIGVITVRFAAAWEEGKEPPSGEKGSRSTGRETDTGPALPEKIVVVKRHFGLPRSTVSVRYSPTGK